MPEMQRLKGMTWDHSRGFDPMIATSQRYAELHPGTVISWEKRSLQAFADRPIRAMTDNFDLLVIDHPHIGECYQDGLLTPLNTAGRERELDELDRNSIGLSHRSYNFKGRQWALAIDAATPVAAFRDDLLPGDVPGQWDDVLHLARSGQVAFALIPINALMTFMGMARNLGEDIAVGDQLIARETGQLVLEKIKEIVVLMDPKCLDLDPIGILDWMGREIDGPAYSPFGYGYTNYSRSGYCQYPITFANAPGLRQSDPGGTVLGGTGIAVSAMSRFRDVAIDFAFWIAGGAIQAGLYFESGGQPGHAAAWESDSCNQASRNFFRNTRRTLDAAWLRPRYPGYLEFQDRAGDIVHACIRSEMNINAALDRLQSTYRESRFPP